MALPQAGVELVAQGLSSFVSDMGKANNAVSGFGDAGEKVGKTFKSGFGEVITGALREVGALAIDALGKAAMATGKFLTDSISLAGDFQAGMQEFQAVAGKDVDTKGLDEFHDLFLQLGKELPVSTSDVQKAAIEMVKGGIDPATVAAGGLRQNIQFAAAAMGGDLVQAAEISSKILGGWANANATAQEKADFLTHATDQLTKAANASSVDVHELSLGIFNAQGTAKAAGVSFDDLTTTLAELAPRFASASEAGNSLKNFMVRLQPTTKPATEAMQDLGLMTTSTTKIMQFLKEKGIQPLGTDLDTLGNQFTEFAASQGFTAKQTTKIWETFAQSKFFDEATGKFIGMQKASQLLQDATKGLTDAQKVQALQTIFGNDAMNSAAALAELGAAGYQKMADSLDKANGVQANAALKQQGFNTALENAKGSVEALQITLGEKLLPVLTTLLNDYIAPGINALSTLAENFFEVHDATGSWTEAIDSLLPGFKSFFDTAKSVAKFIGDNLTPILAGVSAVILAAVIPAFIAWVPVAVTAAGATIAALAPILIPIALIGAAVALLTKAWQSDFLGIRTAVTDFWNKYGLPIFTLVQTWLGKNIPVAVAAAALLFTGTLLPAVKMIWSFISSYMLPIFNALFNVAFAVAKKEVEILAGLWQKVLWPALKIVWTSIDKDVLPVFRKIGDYLDKTFGPVLNTISTWLGKVTGGFKGIGDAIGGVIRWIEKLADKINNIELPSWLTPGSPTPWEHALRSLADALANAVTPALDSFRGALEAVGKAGSVFSSVGGAALGRINDEISANKDNLEWVIAAIEKLADQPADLTETDMQRLNALRAERLRLETEIADETARAARFQKQQDDLGFLQQQMKLLEFIRDNDLNATDLLSGLTLGVGADPNALLDAMTNATAAAVDQLATQIGIQTGTIAPPASAGQILDYGASTTYNGQVGNTFNMPVYTNNTPAAIQQSGAILNALMQ